MVKVKICGITNLSDALASVDAGCDAVGFNFYNKSPRYVFPSKAAKIIHALPRRVVKIGVFVNAREDVIRRIAKLCKLDILQFHGDESPDFCEKFPDFKIIKSFRVKNKESLECAKAYKPFAYLFDTFVKSRRGGTGKTFDWKMIRHIKGLEDRPIFLCGGLTVDNVRKAISAAKPEWVDVCSSVEKKPGIKDHEKIRKLIKAAKGK